MDWCRINPLHVFGGTSTASVHFYNKFDVLHFLSSFCESAKKAAIHFLEVECTTAVKGLPHSKQFAFNRGVINPQDGHILCGRNPVICGVSLRIQWASRIVRSTINKPKEILVAFIKATFLRGPAPDTMAGPLTRLKKP